jgi:UrcA family protein
VWPEKQEIAMFRPITFLIACLIPGALTAWAGLAQADPNIVYTRHVLRVDVHDLDLTRDADMRVLDIRIAQAADRVCGGRPDRGNRYDESELKLLLPAYEKCHSEAIQRASASIKAPAQTLAGNDRAGK